MGLGDQLMATGMAKGAAARGKRIALGDGSKIRWDKNSELIFARNPNIAPPGYEDKSNIEWIEFYRGHRIYNRAGEGRWIWNYEFQPNPGEIFLTRDEEKFGATFGKGFVVIEPNVPAFKSVGPNKQWPVDRYDQVAKTLRSAGLEIVQLVHEHGYRIGAARRVQTMNFRLALAVLARAALYIGPEGGLHHGAAAVGVPGVVLFGGFIPPEVTGYATHTNLTGGAEACGSFNPCDHCKAAMASIPIDQVTEAATRHLTKVAA